MSSTEEKILALGQKRDFEELRLYINKLSVDELLNLIQEKFSYSNFSYTWNYILQGFEETTDSHKKRFEIVMKVMASLENARISSPHNRDVMTRLCMELPKFKTEHLIKIGDFCVERLQNERVIQTSWKELIPELLNVISSRERIIYKDVEMNGLEYQRQLIDILCVSCDITSLTEMLVDMSLSKEEHLNIVNKLGTYFEKLTSDEIPSFVYQFLRFCRHNNGRIFFFKLQEHLGLRLAHIYRETDSEPDPFDAIEISANQHINEAEGTVLYHIHSEASLGQESIKDYLSALKNLLRCPEYIIQGFHLNVLLTISTIFHYEEKVFEIIRSCVSRYYHEEQKKDSSAWFRDITGERNKIEAVFDQVVKFSAEDRDLVGQGLVNFGFVLLDVGSALGRDPIAEKQWQLGGMILCKIMRRKWDMAPTIIERLSNRIITNQSVGQYIACMCTFSKNVPLIMLDNKTIILSLMEGIVQMKGNNAKQLLDAIIPLTKISPTIRDHFIILLRKVLYSKNPESRQVAVIGFLKLLTNLKITNLATLSQSSFSGSFSSGHSLFTQISINRSSQCSPSTFSNEALCLEVLSILRRCFMQQAEVRSQLYEGLLDAVYLNAELGIPILEVIWLHFGEFYNVDDESLPPLKFNKITLTKDVTVTLQEPIGKLVYYVGLLVTKVAKTDSENAAVFRFTNILESLCTRMCKCELVHFELDDGTDLTDIIPEAQHKLIVLKEAMSVYEALIGYKFDSWELESETHGNEINSLFQGYLRLSNYLKNVTRPRKTNSNKKKNVDKTTQQNYNEATIKKDSQKSTKNIKGPDSVLDFHVLSKILSLLHEPMVPWTTIALANILKSKRDLHQHVMQVTLNTISSIKHRKSLDVQTAKNNYRHLCDTALIIFERIIKRLTEFIDFDCTTAVLAAESFLLIFNIIANNYRANWQSFLSKIDGGGNSEALTYHLTNFIEIYQKLFEMDEEEMSENPEIKKISVVIVSTLNFLAHQIPTTNNVLAGRMVDWLKSYAIGNAISSKQVAINFINLLFGYHIRVKSSLTLFTDVAIRLGDVTGVINEEQHNAGEFKVVNDATANIVFISLCSNVKNMLEDIDWMIGRLKAEFNLTLYSSEIEGESRREQLKNRECGICCQLCFIVTILTHLTNCTVPPGNLSEAILKNIILLYATLTSLTKHFFTRSSKTDPAFQRARFDRLIKLAGKQLSPVVYKFILYIEESQKEEPNSPRKKNKSVVDSSTLKSKVLKETRLIPKVVYEIEQFSKFVMQLCKKTTIDLSKFVGQGTVRDFRILHLKEVLGKVQSGTQPTQSTQESDMHETTSSRTDTESPPTKKKKSQH